MERELWAELSKTVADVDAQWVDPRRYRHRTAAVVRVHLWSALHDRPTSWACNGRHWPGPPTRALPGQSTLSRRMRRPGFEAFMEAVGQRLAGRPAASLLKRLDGKPLAVAAHSADRDARWGRGAGQKAGTNCTRCGRTAPCPSSGPLRR